MAHPLLLLPEATKKNVHDPQPPTTAGVLLNAPVAYHRIVTKHSGGTAGDSHPFPLKYARIISHSTKMPAILRLTTGTMLTGTRLAVGVQFF